MERTAEQPKPRANGAVGKDDGAAEAVSKRDRRKDKCYLIFDKVVAVWIVREHKAKLAC